MNWLPKKLEETTRVSASIEIKVKRGRESWNFIYITLTVFLAIGLFVISVLQITWIEKIIAGFFIIIFLTYFCLWDGKFQNKLIWLKTKLEESWKKL